AGGTLSYAWTIEVAPAGSTATLGFLAGAETAINPDVPGEYRIAVSVTSSASGSVTVKRFYLTATAEPVDTAYVRYWIPHERARSIEVHYERLDGDADESARVDRVGVFPAEVTAWSRGGLVGVATITVRATDPKGGTRVL